MKLPVPVVPTIIVLVAIPVLVGLGMWQLDRLAWKERLLTQLADAPAMPVLDLDDPSQAPSAFRRAAISCTVVGKPIPVGRTNKGRAGYSFRVPCRSEAGDHTVMLDLGWAPRHDVVKTVALRSRFEGLLVAMDDRDSSFLLVPPRAPLRELETSDPPSAAEIPNNHRAYAVQWFAFAAILSVIYLIHVAAWRKRRVAGDGAAG